MRRRRFRLRLRTALIAVALVAGAVGALLEVRRMPRRRATCLAKAAFHAAEEGRWMRMARADRETAAGLLQSASSLRHNGGVLPTEALDAAARRQAELFERQAWAILDIQVPDDLRLAADHARRRRRFEAAADRPWRPVPPDE